jgi:glycosyltransferase involved in cell wall biosynthesis
MEQKTNISGFTIVRNASILEYPFRESVLSALPICDEFIINCGDSSDNTAELVKQLQSEYPNKIKVIFTEWIRENQSGGFQLKKQSDLALQQAQSDWCLYIQADEVMHERDHASILAAVKQATPIAEVDGLLFDYIHFYGNFSYQIKGRNWYRKEVRLFKNHRGIEAFRDAQGFRKQGNRLKVIPSGARVFHYGYVRTSESLQKKAIEMAQWWGKKASTSPESVLLKKHVGLSKFTDSHPKWMAEKIVQNSQYCDPMKGKRSWDKNEFKNAVTLVWESIVPYRIGEFKNYDLTRI